MVDELPALPPAKEKGEYTESQEFMKPPSIDVQTTPELTPNTPEMTPDWASLDGTEGGGSNATTPKTEGDDGLEEEELTFKQMFRDCKIPNANAFIIKLRKKGANTLDAFVALGASERSKVCKQIGLKGSNKMKLMKGLKKVDEEDLRSKLPPKKNSLRRESFNKRLKEPLPEINFANRPKIDIGAANSLNLNEKSSHHTPSRSRTFSVASPFHYIGGLLKTQNKMTIFFFFCYLCVLLSVFFEVLYFFFFTFCRCQWQKYTQSVFFCVLFFGVIINV